MSRSLSLSKGPGPPPAPAAAARPADRAARRHPPAAAAPAGRDRGAGRAVPWRGRLPVVDDRDRLGDRGLVGDEPRDAVALAVLDVRGGRAADDPRVLRPAALAGVDHELALRQRHAGQTARQHPDVIAVVHREGTQVGVTRAHPVFDERRDGREHDHGLGDPAAGVGLQPLAQGVELGGRGVGTHDEPLAARAVDRLHDEFGQAVEHLFEGARIFEPPGVDVLQDRLLGEVVPDQVGHVRVEQLVVGDAVAHRVGDGDVAQARGEHEAGSPEHRVGAELQRVEEVVVDAAVDHVDALRAAGGAHEHLAADAQQVASLDELDSHQAREQRVLEVRGVVHTRREHDDVRVVDPGRGRGAQGGEQLVGVVADGAHAHRDEQLGQRLRHDAAVRDDVRDARGHAHVVFEHAHLAVLVADEVDARHLDAHAVGAADAGGLAVEVLRRRDEARGQDAVAHAVLVAVGVVEEGLERAHALLDAGLDARPLVVRDDPGHGIQREGSFLAREVEGHALREVRTRERFGAPAQFFLRHLCERLVQLPVRLARGGGFSGTRRNAEHLVERRDAGCGLARRQRGAVTVEQVTHASTLPSDVLRTRFPPALLRARRASGAGNSRPRLRRADAAADTPGPAARPPACRR